MTGNEAAAIVAERCKRLEHKVVTDSRREAVVCDVCWGHMEELRAKHREAHPPLPTVSVHFVLDGTGRMLGSTLDEARANQYARENNGLVVSWPAAADYRKKDVDG